MSLVYIGMGSNLGARMDHLNDAVSRLRTLPESTLLQHSGVYVTEPVGNRDQRDFFNAVVELQTSLPEAELLQTLQKIERALGRERTKKWAPRTIDLDILAVENIIRGDDPDLRLPHPQIFNRRFVLLPWSEIAPDFIVPGFEQSVRQLLADCRDHSRVELFLTAQAWRQQLQKETM